MPETTVPETKALKLSASDLSGWLHTHPEWLYHRELLRLQRSFRFATYAKAADFVMSVADLAEEAQHHPDLHFYYHKVVLHLSTHDAAGVSYRDTAFAALCQQAYDSVQAGA